MKNGEIENLLDELSSGLKADPEMRLDIKSELRAHLDDKIAEGEQSGLSETESSEQALKSFGDIVTIADSLVAANTPRMKLKAQLWRLVAILMLPSVVICAIVSFYPVLSNLIIVEGMTNLPGTGPLSTPYPWIKKSLKLFGKSYSTEEQLILYGDTTKKYNWQKQKALCDKFPTNKVYLANYTMQLISERVGKGVTKSQIFTELKHAQSIDPDNAIYNYLTAGLMLQDACSYKTETRNYGKRGKQFDKVIDFKIKNRQLLDQAMQEYLAGTRKKYCHSYSVQLLKQQLKIMGKPTTLADNIEQMMLSATTILPQLNIYRQLSKAVPQYIQLRIKEKEPKLETRRLIQSWKPYLQHQFDDSDFLISALVLVATANQFKHSLPPLYRELGEKQQAAIAEQQLQQIVNVRDHWRQDIKYFHQDKIFRKSGVLSNILLPALGIQFTKEDLTPSRRIEYINVEKSLIAILNILFISGMLIAISVIYSWRWRTGTKAILLTPPIHVVGKILFRGSIIPITVYLIISDLGSIGGHEYSLAYNSAIYFQILLLLIFVPGITFYLARKQVITRCQQLAITLPEQKRLKTPIKLILWSTITILGIAALVPYTEIEFATISSKTIFLSTIALTFIAIIIFIVSVSAKFILSFMHREYALYYGALAKTLLPIFALAVILLTLICTPFLNWREASLIKQDKVIFGSPETFTPAEGMAVAKLKNQLEQALKPRVKSTVK